MKGIDAILFFMAMGLFVVGIHQSMIYSISESYWIFMISLSMLFLYGYRKNQRDNQEKKEVQKRKPKKKKKKKK